MRNGAVDIIHRGIGVIFDSGVHDRSVVRVRGLNARVGGVITINTRSGNIGVDNKPKSTMHVTRALLKRRISM